MLKKSFREIKIEGNRARFETNVIEQERPVLQFIILLIFVSRF